MGENKNKYTKYEWISDMKITKSQLKQIIKEELEVVLIEQPVPGTPPSQHGAYEWRTSIPPAPGQEDEEGMKSFVAKEFEAGMNMDRFDLALEKFEVKFRLDYPDSIFKIHDILVDMGDEGLANGLRSLYQEEFDARGHEY